MLTRILLFLIILAASAQAQTRQDVVQWAASASVGTSAFTGYKIYRCNPTPCTPTVQMGTMTTNTYFDTGLANSTTYRYKISAYGPGGETFNASTTDITTYGAPATRNVTCSAGASPIDAAVLTAINASSPGDIVSIGAGVCTSGNVGFTDHANITIQGAGQCSVTPGTCTNITANSGFLSRWLVTGSNQPTMRITGMSLGGTGTPVAPIFIEADQDASWRGGFRIDHMDINYPNGEAGIYLFGPIWGLIDHISCTMIIEACILTSLGIDTEAGPGYGNSINVNNLFGAYSSTLPYTPGVATYLYIEDSTFTAAAGSSIGYSPIDTDYSGCRIVFRHNIATDGFLYSHWTSVANINSCFWEIYSNTFNYTIVNSIYPGRMQGGGTGIIHDNTITGYTANYFLMGDARLPDEAQSDTPLFFCDGTRNWDNAAGDASAPSWPCLMQTGRDAGPTVAQIQAGTVKQKSFPFYIWNNGPQAKCSNQAAAGAACDNSTTLNWNNGGNNCGSGSSNCSNYFLSTPHTVSGGGYGQGDVDWCKNASQPTGCGTHTLIYTPYTYPHPLNN